VQGAVVPEARDLAVGGGDDDWIRRRIWTGGGSPPEEEEEEEESEPSTSLGTKQRWRSSRTRWKSERRGTRFAGESWGWVEKRSAEGRA
jgi:hypothetical protein